MDFTLKGKLVWSHHPHQSGWMLVNRLDGIFVEGFMDDCPRMVEVHSSHLTPGWVQSGDLLVLEGELFKVEGLWFATTNTIRVLCNRIGERNVDFSLDDLLRGHFPDQDTVFPPPF